MTTHLHPLILDHPDLRDIAAARGQLAELRRERSAKAIEAKQRYDTKMTEWKARVDGGEDVAKPGTPSVLDPDATKRFAAAHQNELDRLRGAERQVLIDNADAFNARMAELEGDSLGRAAELVAELDHVARELEPVITTVRKIRSVTGDPMQTVSGNIDAAALVDAVNGGYRLLESEGHRDYGKGKLVFSERQPI